MDRGSAARPPQASLIRRASEGPAVVLVLGSPANRLLRFGLGLMPVLLSLWVASVLALYPFGVDLEIPLRAAARWSSGGEPYLPSAFAVAAGRDLPFLYPPYILPLVTPLLNLPRLSLLVLWSGLCLLTALGAARRLAIPTRFWPLVMIWPPFLEGVLGGNIQVPLFAAFVFACWEPDPLAPWHPRPRRWSGGRRENWPGVLSALVAAVKVSQFHPWLWFLRRSPRSAILGALPVALVVLATLPLTGASIYVDWLHQVSRAGDTSWVAVGEPLARFLPAGLGLPLEIASAVLLLFVPLEAAGVWIGLLVLLGSPSLHTFGWLFLLPASMAVRREVGLVAALFVATYRPIGEWSAFFLVVAALLLARRWPALLEPLPDGSESDRRIAV